MKQLSRKELKTDHFVEEVEHGVEYVSSHKKPFVWGGIAGVVLLVGAIGAYFFMQSGKATRQEALSKAYAVLEAPFGPPAQPGAPAPAYATMSARDAAANKAFAEVAAKYPSSEEGYIAKYFMGTQAANQANWGEAEKLLKEVGDKASKETASMAKYALSQVYLAQNKSSDAEKLLRQLMDNPTNTVSKEQAQLSLGRLLVKSNAAEAKKLLEPLKAGTSAVSRAAIAAQAEIK